jgi:exodeoxyribonuclease III
MRAAGSAAFEIAPPDLSSQAALASGPSMRIATWNVNSLRARLDVVLDWTRRHQPDVLCMQETKVLDDDFPTEEFQRLGYGVAMAGEKSYNGVAIAARSLMRDIQVGFAGARGSDAKRLLAATIDGMRVVCCYVPNGKSLEHPDFKLKLQWLDQLQAFVAAQQPAQGELVVCGDFNVARDERDLFDPAAFVGATHFHPLERAAITRLLDSGLVDAYRLHESGGERYTWWDYRGAAFRKNQGLRIDYVFVSESLARRCSRVWIDREERARDKPSDHAPVIAEFDAPTA